MVIEILSSYFANGSVITGDVDYGSGPYTVTFPAGVTSVPFDVPIIDDNILEDLETFALTIHLASLPDQVSRQRRMDQTTVSIVDNDGKYEIIRICYWTN